MDKMEEKYSGSSLDGPADIFDKFKIAENYKHILIEADERISPITFKPFYVWPNLQIPFRYYFKDKSLSIFIIENIVHNFNWLDECKNKINDSHFFFVYCGWYMDNHHARHYHEMFEYLKLNKNNFFFLFNSIQEKNLSRFYN